jgi:hypothetical protein
MIRAEERRERPFEKLSITFVVLSNANGTVVATPSEQKDGFFAVAFHARATGQGLTSDE